MSATPPRRYSGADPESRCGGVPMPSEECQMSKAAVWAWVCLIAVVGALTATAAQHYFFDDINAAVSGGVAGALGGTACVRLMRRSKCRTDAAADGDG